MVSSSESIRWALIPVLFLLSACVDPGTSEEPPLPEEPVWYGEVEPLVREHCARCHHPVGSAKPDLTWPDTAVESADLIAEEVRAERMPPPVSDPACMNYANSEVMTLDAAERELLLAWSEGRADLGDPEDAMGPWQADYMEDADLEIRIPEPYRPTFSDPLRPGVEHRCFVLQPDLPERVYLEAFEPIIDRPDLVRNMYLWVTHENNVYDAWRDPQGFDCVDDFRQGGFRATWGPGGLPMEHGPGMGSNMDPEFVFVLEIQYVGAEKPGLDQSGFRIRTTPDAWGVQSFRTGNNLFTIPPDAAEHVLTSYEPWTPPYDIEIVGAFPQLRQLGTGYRLWVERAAGDRCLLQGDGWDSDHQPTYMFDEAVRITDGDRIHFECRWDNSAGNPEQLFDPPQEIPFGQLLHHELCWFYLFRRLPAPQ